MLTTAKLLLPALIPSWRFFDIIAPSPRIEFTLLKSIQDTSGHWQEFRPRPLHVPMSAMLKRMFWNPRWNEELFLVSCAERIMEGKAQHSSLEIIRRIQFELEHSTLNIKALPYLQFRLVFISRQGTQLQKNITFTSPVYHCGNVVS